MGWVSSVAIDTDGSPTDTLVTAAFPITGSNRHVDVVAGQLQGGAGAFAMTSFSRGSETYGHKRTDDNPSGSVWAHGSFWASTTEPQAASAAMTGVSAASEEVWGFTATAYEDIDQTTRFRDLGSGVEVALNPDGDGAINALAITSAVGDTIISAICVAGDTAPTAPVDTDVTQTLRASWSTGPGSAVGLVATAPGATLATLDWNNTQFRFVHYVASHPPPSYTPPTATIETPPGGAEAVLEPWDAIYLSSSVSDGEAPYTHLWAVDEVGSGVANQSDADPGLIAFPNPGTWTLRYTVTDNQANSDSDERTIVVLPSTLPAPSITSNGGGDEGNINVPENTTAVTTVSATQSGEDPLVFSILDAEAGGEEDSSLFTIHESTGALAFIAAPDYETPTDADMDGVYDVTVAASDEIGVDTQVLHITVTDVSLLANAGPDQTVQVGSLVQLDGGNSEQYESVTWEFLLKPDGSLAVLSDDELVNPTFLPDLPGAYTLRLTVTDAASPAVSATDDVVITASELAVIIPMYVAAYRPPTVPGHRRTAGVPASTIELWKYPKDLYDVAVDWEADDVLPAGATALGTLTVVVKNAGGSDVTGTLVASSGVDGLISWAQLQAGTAGLVYDVILTQAFNNGQSLDRYVQIQVRNPRDYVVHAPFKYPADKYPIPVEWAGRRPRGNPALSTLITKAYDAVDADETSTYVAGSFVAGTIGAGYLLGGTGGESRLLEFAQEFSNGRKFHEYAMLTVEVPPA